MADKKIIAVVGATGAPGGRARRAILTDKSGGFSVPRLTRDPWKDKAKELAESGRRSRGGDLDDVESLTQAFDGAYGAFCVTNFWEHFSGEKGDAQAASWPRPPKRPGVAARDLVDARGHAAMVPLDDDRMPTLQGKYKVPHFDAKADGEPFFRTPACRPLSC